ncbi:alpha/beta hydrolase [Anaeromicropila herbilytica]|uniref:Thioesterase n=1 Tax=Anaeromicropila herbilytica TaxID=2785025 RepID=A0A7R7EKX3_9FIRM|nr:alpha/beta hydrolase [Anaeromicropila herbilytica]BCN30672.1 thioesterase [Anaeromicropila herbilytica]
MKSRKILKRIGIGVLIVILALFSAFFIYTLNYYKADQTAKSVSKEMGSRMVEKNNRIIYYPEKEKDLKTGFIFYPGGKVEPKAYSPLLMKLSNEGITCILAKMPFKLAVFHSNAANKIYKDYPEIENWYIGGHSLGGAMASKCASDGTSSIWKGLILLGAYPVGDIEVPSLTLYGSEDKVLNKSKLTHKNEFEISGGNHAYYGNYGEQKGDGKASITREEQQKIVVDKIMNFIDSNQKE